MKFLLFFVAAIVAFLIYSKQFYNPYKLIFIFGKKGAGKSSYMVKKMLLHQKFGWTIYTDMLDCFVPGARIINALDLANFIPPRRSLLCLEEVGITFDNRKYKTFEDGIRDFVKFQRKYGVKCYMNSQGYDCDKKIKDCIDSMILMTSIRDTIAIARPIDRSVALVQPTGDSDGRVGEGLKFTSFFTWEFLWLPTYHKYFDSFSAPARPPIPYEEVTLDYVVARKGSVPEELQKAFSSYEKKK